MSVFNWFDAKNEKNKHSKKREKAEMDVIKYVSKDRSKHSREDFDKLAENLELQRQNETVFTKWAKRLKNMFNV